MIQKLIRNYVKKVTKNHCRSNIAFVNSKCLKSKHLFTKIKNVYQIPIT